AGTAFQASPFFMYHRFSCTTVAYHYVQTKLACQSWRQAVPMPFSSPTSMAYRRLWSLAWPLILTNLTVPLLGLVDTAVLGHLDSPVYLGAVAISANLFTILYWSFGFLRMGTTGFAAQASGA